jgi:hypothetical protein
MTGASASAVIVEFCLRLLRFARERAAVVAGADDGTAPRFPNSHLSSPLFFHHSTTFQVWIALNYRRKNVSSISKCAESSGLNILVPVQSSIKAP